MRSLHHRMLTLYQTCYAHAHRQLEAPIVVSPAGEAAFEAPEVVSEVVLPNAAQVRHTESSDAPHRLPDMSVSIGKWVSECVTQRGVTCVKGTG
jgi:hypothetical protein